MEKTTTTMVITEEAMTTMVTTEEATTTMMTTEEATTTMVTREEATTTMMTTEEATTTMVTTEEATTTMVPTEEATTTMVKTEEATTTMEETTTEGVCTDRKYSATTDSTLFIPFGTEHGDTSQGSGETYHDADIFAADAKAQIFGELLTLSEIAIVSNSSPISIHPLITTLSTHDTHILCRIILKHLII